MTYKIKEVLSWLKSLDENKWRKTYKVDARRITYFANHGTDAELPESLAGKREREFTRERKLAERFLNSREQNESTVIKTFFKSLYTEVRYPNKKSNWYEFARTFDIGVYDLDIFAIDMGYKHFNDMDASIQPFKLYAKNPKAFVNDLKQASRSASSMGDNSIHNAMKKLK